MTKTAGWIIGLVALAATAYWLTLPPDGLVLDESCAPGDPQAAVSALLHPQSFWMAQKAAVEDTMRAEFSLQASKEKRRDQSAESHSSIEQRMTRLSNRDVSGDEQAVAQAQREQMARLAKLARCQSVINQNLSP